MKHLPLFLALFVLLMASCTSDESTLPIDQTEAAVHFSLQTAPMVDNSPSTRSTDTLTIDDTSIDNVWIFQFMGGVFQRKLYFKPTDWSNFEVNLIGKGSSDLYFVANVGPNAFAADFAPTTASDITTLVETEAACLYPASGKQLIPMRGCVKGIVPNKELMQTLQVNMFRAMARIDYTYSVSAAMIAQGFTINKIRLRNVSANVLFDSVTANVYPVFENLKTQNFSYETGISNTSRTFTFYVPDNRRGTGSNTDLTDARFKSGLPGATYVEMVGTTSAGDEYTFSLYPGADAYNDYNIRANTHYQLTANLVGLSRIDGRIKKTTTEPSNCYILAPGSSVNIPVSRANSSALGTQLADVTSGWTAFIYWQTSAGLVTVSANASDMALGRFTVTAPSGNTSGNAVVAVKNASGDVVWSWHIWVTNYNPAVENEGNNGFVWMSRNLGATAVANGTTTTFATCGGLMYQWGRKDPFPGSDGLNMTSPYTAQPIYTAAGTLMTSASLTWPTDGTPTVTGTTGDVVKIATLGATAGTQIPFASQLAYSVKYPLLDLVNWGGSTATVTAALTAAGGQSAWGGLNGETKSVYDPCPVGWRVPSFYKTSTTLDSPWSTWTTTQTLTTSAFAALKWDVAGVFGSYYYPAAGNRNYSSGALGNVGVRGYYWGASPSGTNGYYLSFYSGNVNPSNSINRASGFGVRCVQE